VNNRILRSVDNRDAQIGKLQDKISVLQDSVVKYNEKLSDNQEIFLSKYLSNKEKKLLVLGEKLQSNF
jgi:hypothetical protein